MGQEVTQGLDWELQEELESMALHWGAQRFKRRWRKAAEEGDATRVGAARRLLLEAVSQTEVVIQGHMDRVKPGPRHMALPWVERVGKEVASYLACKVVLGHLTMKVRISLLARRIAEYLLDEVKCSRFQELAPGLFQYRMSNFQTTSRVHMARSISATMSHALCTACREDGKEECSHLDTSDLQLSSPDRLKLGTFLVRMVLEAFPGWLEVQTIAEHTRPGRERSRVRRITTLMPTEKARAWVEARNEILAELVPVALPMVVPPAQWGPKTPGGYRFGLLGKYLLARTSRRHTERIEGADIPLVYEAVNRIQETPWRINLRVLEVVEKIEEAGGGLGGFPEFEPVPVPVFDGKESDPDFKEALKDFKVRKVAAIEAEQRRLNEVRKWVNVKTVVSTVRNEPAIWFPHNLDFRGRVYPIPTFLHPQGDDRARGLLEFADSHPLGERGVHWLAIHGANCLGETPGGEKMSRWTLEERAQWMADQSVRVKHTAMEPFSDLWWTDADKPWQFLAYCFAWEEMLREDDPAEYECYVPVSVDGTCNGLQHFAGMLRDVPGAKAVNVWPNERPEDVYTRVADRVNDRLVAVASGAGEEADYAQRWLASGLVGRKLCKRPTMTFGYGSKTFGFTDQVLEYLRLDVEGWEKIRDEHFVRRNEDGQEYLVFKQASAFIAQILWEALGDTVPGAFEAMAWMQDAARTISKSGRAVQWTVPETEFPVIQDAPRYFELDLKRVRTTLAGGVEYRPAVYEKKARQPDRIKQANAVAPNVVHSLDAAALMKTVCMANHDGVEYFAMVHDSFGTHPGRMDVLVEATRQAFFHLYSRHDVAEELYHEFLNQVDDLTALDPPPELGDLDVSVVLASDYFFA